MNIEREIKVRDAIKYCIENFDSQTATNRIVEFWKDELKLQEQQCNIANVVGRNEQLVAFLKRFCDGYDFENNAEKIVKEYIMEEKKLKLKELNRKRKRFKEVEDYFWDNPECYLKWKKKRKKIEKEIFKLIQEL